MKNPAARFRLWSCLWLGALLAPAAVAAAPVQIPKQSAAALPRNDPGAGICATVVHVADPANGLAPFSALSMVPAVVDGAAGTIVSGLSIDGKAATIFSTINFRNAQPGAIGDFTGPGTNEAYFPFSQSPAAMPPGNDRNFAARVRGYLNVQSGSTVTIAVNADDAATLSIGGVTVVATQELVSARAARQVAFGGPGLYPVELVYYQNGSAATLEVSQASSAQSEGNLTSLSTTLFNLWSPAVLYTTLVGQSPTCQECGGSIAIPCPLSSSCIDGLCHPCDVASACGSSCQPCAARQVCSSAGLCVQCVSDFDCRGAQVCDTQTSLCTAGTACTSDKDCGAGKLCDPLRQVCLSGSACQRDQDCPPGLTCDPVRTRCLPYSCMANSDCPNGQVCNTDRALCEPACQSNTDCSAGTCDTTLQICVVSCQNDTQCGSDQLCDLSEGRCAPRCSTDLQCSPIQRCDTTLQRCAAFCASNADCGSGLVCDTTRSLCTAIGGEPRYVGGIAGCSAAGRTGGAGPLWPALLLLLAAPLWAAARRRWRLAAAGLVFFSATLLGAGEARADISVNTLTFQPTLGPDGVITVEGTRTPKRLHLFSGAIVEFAYRPLVLLGSNGQPLVDSVNSVTAIHLSGGVGVTDWLAFGVHLPVALYQDFDRRTPATDVPVNAAPSAFGVGDLRLWSKVRIFDNSDHGIGLALVPQIIFPTGQNLRSGNSFDFDLLRAALDYRWQNGAFLALNFSFLFRSSSQQVLNVLIGHQVKYGLGAFIPVHKSLGVMAELAGATSMQSLVVTATQSGQLYSMLEGHAGLRWHHDNGLSVQGGVGTGFTDAVGSPQLRVFAGINYVPARAKKPAPVDPDPDHDGVLGTEDRCPLVFGPAENQGCPDGDTDKDGIVDRLDKCPLEAGPAPDGCPDKDSDGDGIIDRMDRCPNQPGPADNQGCPDKDTDGDGIVDRLDQCPFDPGPAPDGCPKRKFISVKEDKIELLQKVYFATGKAIINRGSFPLLDEVADVLKKRATMELRVEGHTDNTGSLALNLRLSKERAESVRSYLIKKGVDSARLTAEGFGPNRPVDDNATAAGRDKNRRTEFVILKQ